MGFRILIDRLLKPFADKVKVSPIEQLKHQEELEIPVDYSP